MTSIIKGLQTGAASRYPSYWRSRSGLQCMVSGSLRNGSLSECTSFLRAKFRRRSKPSIYLHACPSDQNNRPRKCLPMAYQTSGSDCQSASLGCRRKKHLSDFPWQEIHYCRRMFSCFLSLLHYVRKVRAGLQSDVVLLRYLPAVFAEIHSDQQTSFFNFLWYFFWIYHVFLCSELFYGSDFSGSDYFISVVYT